MISELNKLMQKYQKEISLIFIDDIFSEYEKLSQKEKEDSMMIDSEDFLKCTPLMSLRKELDEFMRSKYIEKWNLKVVRLNNKTVLIKNYYMIFYIYVYWIENEKINSRSYIFKTKGKWEHNKFASTFDVI
jgi:hypothetical protein